MPPTTPTRRSGRWVVIAVVVLCALVLLNWVIKRAGAGGPRGHLVLLEVYPNERAPGGSAVALQPGAPVQPSAQSAGPGDYLWKVYEFHAPGNLRIQVCAQAFSASQNKSMIGLDQPDVLRIRVDDVIPSDAWEVQSGPPGRAQWDGAKDQGKRTTLEFLVTGLQPGRHALSFHAWGCPIIYWIKVSDLEHR